MGKIAIAILQHLDIARDALSRATDATEYDHDESIQLDYIERQIAIVQAAVGKVLQKVARARLGEMPREPTQTPPREEA